MNISPVSIMRSSDYNRYKNFAFVNNKGIKHNQHSFENIRNYNNKNILLNNFNISFKQSDYKDYNLKVKKQYEGCLIGGAIGDAFGSKIEALNINDIKKKYGNNGLRYLITHNGEAEITDDTQMTLFTAFALIKSKIINNGKFQDSCINEIVEAYKDWYKTQTTKYTSNADNNILLRNEKLYEKKFPGKTCIDELSNKNMEDIYSRNSSMGAGGLMRVSPIGLIAPTNEIAFDIGVKSAMITHGNSQGYLPAGVLASIIQSIICQNSIEESIIKANKQLSKYGEDSKKISQLITKAITLSKQNINDQDAISELGRGWIAPEILAISIYCALKYQNNFKEAIIASVNNSGDSDTIASITGNIIGAYIGIDNIPAKYKNRIELNDIILKMANDLYSSVTDIENTKNDYNAELKEIPQSERRKEDIFIFKSKNIILTDEEKNKLKTLPLKEAIEYKKYLIRKNFNIN